MDDPDPRLVVALKLPPLNAVRAFDAVARHRGVRAAADELHVTPGAVSQQLRLLEDWLGTRLFDRLPGGLRATEAGTQFHAACSRALRAIAQAAERIRPGGSTVRVSVLPTVASRWLLPALDDFTRAHPAVEVEIEATMEVADFERDATDLAVRHALPDLPPGLHARVLFPERLVPVCTPAFRRAHVRRGRLQAGARLLHETGPYTRDLWPRWLESQPGHAVDPARGLWFSHEMLAHDAAASGQGVALANPFLVRDRLAGGALVMAVPHALVTGKAYLAVWPDRPLREPAQRFLDWLVARAARDAALPDAGDTPVSAPAPSSGRRRPRTAAAP